MGIQNYLKRVSKATKDLKSAIAEKGVQVAECDGIEQLADKVRAITQSTTTEADMLFLMLAFKSSTNMPGTPSGGSFSKTSISYPSGWSDGAGLTENVWMSYCIVKGDGSVYKNWVQPIKISGTSSGTVDLSAYATKAWVTDQIAKISTGGDIDLSAYATKDYVQSEISKISTGGSEVTKSYVDTRDADTLKSAKSYADSLVQDSGVVSVNSMSGAITLKGSETVIIDRGEDGQSLVFTAKGGSTGGGNDGDTIRSFNIYINTDSNTEVPEIPTTVGKAPYWDYTSGDLKNIPTGWATDCTNDATKYTWMSSAFFSKNSAGAMIGTWTTPLCITGEPGKPGEDGANFEFIYALTSDSDKKPNYPSASSDLKTLFDNAETNGSTTYNGQRWYDRAQSIDPTTNRACWMAQRVKYAGADDWSFYSSTPVLWANWGSDGTDGDGVEYIFFLTDDAHQTGGKWTSDAENFEISYTENGTVNGVSTPYANTVDDWVPKGWTDEPQDVSKTDGFYEFCAIRKSKDGVWQEFSTPALWAKFAMDGKDGASIEYVFARYTEELDPSKVSVDNDAANRDGAGTTDEYLPNFIFDGTTVKATDDPASVSEEYPYQWVSIRRKKTGESVWGDFSHPSLWNMWSKGSQGPKGEDGDNWEFVYALSEVADTPTVDTSTPATGSPTQNVSEDGFLPKFVFTAGSVDTVAEQPSVNETQKYCYQSKRRKHNGTWLSFSTPSMVANFVKAGITPDEIADIKKDVTNQLSTELNNAEKNVKALEERLSKIDGTDATFLVDNKKGIIQALTQYKSENQTSFSDLVLDGSEAKFKTMVGAEHDDILSGAGITMDGLAGTVKSFATYQEKTDDAVKRLNNAETRLNAAEATIENAVTSTTFEKTLKENNETVNQKITNMAKSTLDAAKAEINQTVATGVWIWAVWDKTADAEKAEDLNYTPVGDILATKPYDTRMFLTWTDSKGVKHTPGQNGEEGFAPTYDDDGNLLKTGEELYRESIEGTKWSEDETKYWTRTVEAKAFSRIIQQAGSIDLHAYGEEGSFARIFLDATKKGSEITLEADTVYFTEGSTINADNLVLRNISVTGNPENKTGDEVEYGAGIEYAQINNCKINSCEIASQIKSKTYVAHKDTENTEGKGFLIDSGAVAADGLEFAFYSEDGGRITNHEIITKKISSTNFSSEDGNKAGFSLDGSDKNNTFAFYGKTSSGDKFELTNDSLVIPSAVIGDITVDTLVSKDYSEATSSTAGIGFSLDGKTNTFAFYGDKTDDGEVAFKLTNTELEIPSAYIKNLTTGNITNFDDAVWGIVDANILTLSKNISTVLAEQADFYVKTLSTKDSDYHRLYIGADAVTTETNSVAYSDGYDSGEQSFSSTGYWEPTISVGNSITAKSGQTLKIPSISWQAWGWFAYTINRSSKNELVKLFLVKKNSSGKWEDVQTIYTWNETWGAKSSHNSHSEDGRYTTATTYDVTSDGEYALQFRISLEHPGNNAKGWSKLRFNYGAYTLKTTSAVSGTTGITINPTTFIAKNSTSISSKNIQEASLSITAQGITSTGFVLSNTINCIRTVDNASDCDDQNTLYIILK